MNMNGYGTRSNTVRPDVRQLRTILVGTLSSDAHVTQWLYTLYNLLSFFSFLCKLYIFVHNKSDVHAEAIWHAHELSVFYRSYADTRVPMQPAHRACWVLQSNHLTKYVSCPFSFLPFNCSLFAPKHEQRTGNDNGTTDNADNGSGAAAAPAAVRIKNTPIQFRLYI